MHVLIIEDEPLIAALIEDIARDGGATTIDIVDSFTGALAAAARHPPDLITSDVNLAQGSGIDAVEAITSLIAPRVVFVTGSIDEVLSRLPEATIVPKPFSAAALSRVLATVVRGG